MDWQIKEYPIAALYLDQQNIRTPISDEDQNALIRDMFANEDAFEIVRSFVQNYVFPDEFPICIKENGKKIIIEGNRRLAALKALNEPNIIPAWTNRIKALRNPNIVKIRVVLAPDREAAIKHIANKHTINYRRPWKPLREAYFYKSQIENGKSINELINEFPDHNVPRFIKMLQIHHLAKSININDSLKAKVHDDRDFPITSLERFYTDKNVSKFLGIEFDKLGKVKGKIDKNEFAKGFTKIIEDVATGDIDSRKYNKIEQRKKYINDLPNQYKPDLSKTGSFGSSDFKELDVPKKNGKGRERSKKMPKGLFIKADVPFKLPSTSLRLMYNELSDIEVKTFPNATHDLLRSFLECVLVFYLKATKEYGLVKARKYDNPSLSEMLTFISSKECKSILDNNIKRVVEQIKSNYAHNYSLARMNMINHNENWNSNEKEVRSAWGKMESLFKVLLNPPK
jgi:hypothetical protein